MATVTVITKAEADHILDQSVVSGVINGSNHLILTRHDGSTVDAGDLSGLLVNALLTGDPKAPTPAAGDNDTSIATTKFVKDQGYAKSTDVATALGDKADLNSPVLTGDPQAPTPPATDNDVTIATTAFVQDLIKTLKFTGTENPHFGGVPPAGTLKITKQGSVVANVSGAGGALAINFDSAFPNGVVSVVAWPGDTASGIGFLVLRSSSVTKVGFTVTAYQNTNNLMPAAAPVRTDYIAIGW